MMPATNRIWLPALFSVATATILSFAIVELWDRWSAAILVGYGIAFSGGLFFIPYKRPFGSALFVGLLLGLLIPAFLHILRH